MAELEDGSARATVVPLADSQRGIYSQSTAGFAQPTQIAFNRKELSAILKVYGRNVAAGEWRDYAIDQLKDRAIFSIFRRTSEMPLFRVEKIPKLTRKQGQYAILTASGRIMKRGHDLDQVLKIFDKRLTVVD